MIQTGHKVVSGEIQIGMGQVAILAGFVSGSIANWSDDVATFTEYDDNANIVNVISIRPKSGYNFVLAGKTYPAGVVEGTQNIDYTFIY